jgi:hypothetical protein
MSCQNPHHVLSLHLGETLCPQRACSRLPFSHCGHYRTARIGQNYSLGL